MNEKKSAVSSWSVFADGLRQAGEEVLAKLPARLRGDPQIEQEVWQLMLGAVAQNTIESLSADGDHPVFLPFLNESFKVFQPNSDTVYKKAVITPGGTYRLRGELGSLPIANIGQFGPLPDETGAGLSALGYHDFKTLHLDEKGHFDVILSPTRPAGYQGDWWKLEAGTTSVWTRQVGYDWGTARDPRLSIERLDKPVSRPRRDVADLEQRLRRLPKRIANSASFLIDHVEKLRSDGYINRFKVLDLSKMAGLAGQFYYEGAYEIAPDEALIVEAKVPAVCQYWSLILTNDLWVTTDWYNNQSSLNGAQARVDEDGMFRIVVSLKDPGVPNWLDAAGYPSGVIQGRWTGCSETPIPTLRKVALADVRKFLPTGTPSVSLAEREQAVRERRSHAQMRPLW